jgi:hypothetical protein
MHESGNGTFRTWSDVRLESVVRTKADSADYYRFMGSRPRQVGKRRWLLYRNHKPPKRDVRLFFLHE